MFCMWSYTQSLAFSRARGVCWRERLGRGRTVCFFFPLFDPWRIATPLTYHVVDACALAAVPSSRVNRESILYAQFWVSLKPILN